MNKELEELINKSEKEYNEILSEIFSKSKVRYSKALFYLAKDDEMDDDEKEYAIDYFNIQTINFMKEVILKDIDEGIKKYSTFD